MDKELLPEHFSCYMCSLFWCYGSLCILCEMVRYDEYIHCFICTLLPIIK